MGGAQGFPSGCIFWISRGIAEVPPGAWPRAARRAPTGFSSLSETSGSCLKRQRAPPAAFHLPPPPLQHLPPGTPRDPRPMVPSLPGSPGPAVAEAMPASDIKVCRCRCSPTPPLFLGGSHGMPMPMPAGDANGVGVAKQVGAGGGGGGQAGHTGPRSHSLPAGLFLTQPVQLVHVVVSGERNLGNVVIWRRTCPLGGNGTAPGESRGTGTGRTGTGTAAGGGCEGAAQGGGRDVVRGRMGAGDAWYWVLGTRCWAGTAPLG